MTPELDWKAVLIRVTVETILEVHINDETKSFLVTEYCTSLLNITISLSVLTWPQHFPGDDPSCPQLLPECLPFKHHAK